MRLSTLIRCPGISTTCFTIVLMLQSLVNNGQGTSLEGIRQDPAVDWPSFMAAHDMHWSKPPTRWQEAPHFGNAMIGSMLYQDSATIRLQLFRADVQDHRDDSYGWTAYSRPRLGIGSLHLHPIGKITGCTWRIDLWNAELTGTITTDKGSLFIRHYVHSLDMVVVTEINPTSGEKDATWSWTPIPAISTRPGYPTTPQQVADFANQYGKNYEGTLKLAQANPAGKLTNDNDVLIWQQDLFAGGQYATAWTEKREPDGRRILLTTIAHSYPTMNACNEAVSTLRTALSEYSPQWSEEHRSWWHNYYQRSFVHIPDAQLEALYWQTIYRYGCSSRKGRMFVDCPGIWFQGGGWCYTTTDYNIQAAHWAVGAANRMEQGMELMERFHAKRVELIKAVRPVEWQTDAAYLPIEVAGDLQGNREQDMRYYWCLGNLPWALNDCWMLYRYTMDDAMLRDKLFPLLRRSINLYLHLLKEDKDGKLHLPPTYSPETGIWEDCNYDLALLKWGCHTLLNACYRLKLDDPLIPRWQEVLERTPDYPTDNNGYMLGRNKTASDSHRHGSHLLMIYPLNLVNIDHKEALEVMRKSYERFNSIKDLPAMVQTHAGPIAASLGLGDAALKGLMRQMADLHPNGMWYTPPCLETSLSMANTLQNMLIQSWCDPADRSQISIIRIFPAVPASWQEVVFHDLRAEGAFLISAERINGKTVWVSIKSLAGEPCRIRVEFATVPILKINGKTSVTKLLAPNLYELPLLKGDEAILYVSNANPAPKTRNQ